MPGRTKTPVRNSKRKPSRYSLTVPPSLAVQVRRVARERHLTIGRALVELAERGVQTELEANDKIDAAYEQFMRDQDTAHKSQAGKNLIRTIFGKDSIAEDPQPHGGSVD